MTLLYFDGFETYGLGEDVLNEAQDAYNFGDTLTIGDGTFETSDRIPSGQLLQYNTGVLSDADKTFDRTTFVPLAGLSSEDTWIAGMAFRVIGGYPGSTGYCHIFDWRDRNNAAMVSVRVRGNGDVQIAFVDPPSDSVVIETAVNAIPDPTVWHYIESKITFHGSSGEYYVRVDGTEIMSDTGVQTSLSSETRPGIMRTGHFQSRQTQFDDFYLLDDQGSAPTNDFLSGPITGGDVFVKRIRPEAAGVSTQFTKTGVANWSDVAEDKEDGDSSYVESKTATEKDLYNYEDISPFGIGEIFGVIAKPVLKKTTGGSRTYRLLCKSNATEDPTGTRYASAGSYVRQTYIWETNPDAALPVGTAWTVDTFNAAQFGLEIIS
jgi:hypothetical protein